VERIVKEIGHRIVIDPKVRFGKPVIKGTRVDVEHIIERVATGMSLDEIANEYSLDREDVRAALRYAAHLVSLRRVRE
jgi:uncharacterized protein (DUF433 family)